MLHITLPLEACWFLIRIQVLETQVNEKNQDEDSELIFFAMDKVARKGVVKASADTISAERLLMLYYL